MSRSRRCSTGFYWNGCGGGDLKGGGGLILAPPPRPSPRMAGEGSEGDEARAPELSPRRPLRPAASRARPRAGNPRWSW
jgi:hypothetical protein